MNHIPLFSILCLIGIIASFLLVKPLNILLLGPQYAESLGISTRQIRNILLVVVGLLTAITTAFCGPISFIGLAIPHIARLLFRTENHQILLPGTVLSGAAITLLCNFICYLPGESGIIPLNAVTPLIGAPVIIYVIIQRRYLSTYQILVKSYYYSSLVLIPLSYLLLSTIFLNFAHKLTQKLKLRRYMMWGNSHDCIIIRGAFKHIRLISRSRIM